MTRTPLVSSKNTSNQLEIFLEMMAAERGAALNTIESYRRDLEKLNITLIKNHKTFLTANTSDIQQHLHALKNEHLEATSMARAVSCFRQFYKFLKLEKLRSDNPCNLIDTPKTRRSLPRILSEQDITQLLNVAHQDMSKEGLRLTALLEMLYATGLRVTELISLPFTAIPQSTKAENFHIIVKGKGNKERMVPLNKHAVNAIEQYLMVRCEFMDGSTLGMKWLFPSRSKEGHLTRQRFAQLLKELATAANIPLHLVSPHVIRHAFASHLLHHGADLISIQKMLGHANISTTQIYTHIQKDKLYALVERHHPLSEKYQ